MMKLRHALLLATALVALPSILAAQEKGGIINVATIGEPPTLDPMASTADLVGIVTQHIFETLYTFDKKWNVTPLLAEAMPEISADGKIYTIKLRTGIKFHDNSDMTAEDVVASLARGKRSPRAASRSQASSIQSPPSIR
jgi:peptide/nickel transport system substrate-binding protein